MSGMICRDLMIMYTIILLLSVYLIFNFYFLHCIIRKVIEKSEKVTFIDIINILLYISNISLLVLAIHYYKDIKPFTKNTNVNNIAASLVLSIINFFGLLVNLYFCVPNFYSSSDSFLFFYQINYAIFNVLLIVLIMILFSIEIYRNNNRHPLSSSINAILPPPQRSNTAGTTPPMYSSGSRFSFLG
jgi:hypothetical protein